MFVIGFSVGIGFGVYKFISETSLSHYFFQYFTIHEWSLVCIGACFWSILSTVLLNVPNKIWENLDKALSNSCLKLLWKNLYTFCIEWFSTFVCYRTPSWPLNSFYENQIIQFQLWFWSICNYQIHSSWVYRIFETGLIFDNIFATVDLTEIFTVAKILSKIRPVSKIL